MHLLHRSLLLLCVPVLLSACSGDHVRRQKVEYSNQRFDAFDRTYGGEAGRHSLVPTPARMVQHSAQLHVAVKEADVMNDSLQHIASRFAGYVVSLSDTRSVIRVRQEDLKPAVDAVSALGRIRHSEYRGEDVTEQHMDLTLRLDNARRARDRYLELLAQAENVTAALAVEKELERVNGEIESMEGKLSRLTHLVELSTITVRIEEQQKLGPLGYVFVGLWKGVSWLFVRNP
jgi:hypothetical protein